MAATSNTIPESVSVHIRWMLRRDLFEILEIENSTFEYPWSENDFINLHRQQNGIGMVAEYEDQIVGFMLYELFKDRIHIVNFAVHPDYRNRGIGAQMAQTLIRKLSHNGRSRIVLEVRETNLDAQLFFQRIGFLADCVLPGFYDDTDEDAYRMEYYH